MTAIADVRSLLQAAVATTGIRTYAYIQDALNADVATAHVVPLEYDPRMVLGESKAAMDFQVRVYLSRAAATDQNQKKLDLYRDFTGELSIVLAVQATATVDYVMVTRVGEVGVIDYGGAPYLMFEIDMEVCW